MISLKTLSLLYAEYGNPSSVLRLVEREIEPLKPGEVLVRMRSCPINPSDLIPIHGAYAHRIKLPAIAGYEGVGEVCLVGEGVPSSLLGQRVLPLRGDGTWQTYVKVPLELIIPVPEGVSDEIAAQAYINPVTALLLSMKCLSVSKGAVVVVNAASSALGRLLIQFSRLYGFHVIAVVRNFRHAATLRELGAIAVVDSTSVGVGGAVMRLTNGTGVDIAIDSVGGVDGEQLLLSVKPHGQLVSVGLLSGTPANWSEIARARGVTIQPFWLRRFVERASREEWHQAFQLVFHLIQAGKLTLMPIAERIPFVDFKRALSADGAPGRFGKVHLMFD